MVTSNYRPIAVGEALARLLAVLLQRRIDEYLESNGLRCDMQAGFRRKLSTCHHLFTLQHFIDKCKTSRVPLYGGYVDLQSAYDLTHRDVLWVVVQNKGIHGKFLHMLQALYAKPEYAVCINGCVGKRVLSRIGVRQGCPLSPTLFALVLDDLHSRLLSAAALHAPSLEAHPGDARYLHRYQERKVPNLDYADDVIVLSLSKRGLQLMITAFADFCRERALKINVKKTKVVCLVRGSSPEDVQHPQMPGCAVPIWCDGVLLPCDVDHTKYLGLHVATDRGMRVAAQHLRDKAVGKFRDFQRKIAHLQCEASIQLRLRMYLTIVQSTMLYGAEVWSVLPQSKVLQRQLFTLFHQHLRVLAGLPPSACHKTLLLALDILPIKWSARLRAVRFWCSLWSLPPTHFLRHVVFDNWLQFIAYGCQNYSKGICLFLRDKGLLPAYVVPGSDSGALPGVSIDRTPCVPHADVLRRLLDRRGDKLTALVAPNASSNSGSVLATYVRWHRRASGVSFPPLHVLPLSLQACHTLLGFQLGCSPLPMHAGRLSGVPHAARTCPLCPGDVVADEFHMLFVCPALVHLRHACIVFPNFLHHQCVRRFMWQRQRFAVAGILLKALAVYRQVSEASSSVLQGVPVQISDSDSD